MYSVKYTFKCAGQGQGCEEHSSMQSDRYCLYLMKHVNTILLKRSQEILIRNVQCIFKWTQRFAKMPAIENNSLFLAKVKMKLENLHLDSSAR